MSAVISLLVFAAVVLMALFASAWLRRDASRTALLVVTVLVSAAAAALTAYMSTAPTQSVLDSLTGVDRPENSLTAHTDRPDAELAKLKAYARAATKPQRPMSPASEKRRTLPAVDVMIGRLADRLEREPGNADDWRMLGWSYFHTNRYDKAVDAYARAVALRPGDASWKSEYGAALTKASGGNVSDKAMTVFKQALKLNPSDRNARFYTSLAKAQSSNKRGALEDWIALLKDHPDADDWSQDLRAQILTLAKEIGEDVSDRLPSVRRTDAPAGATKPQGAATRQTVHP